MVDNTDYELTDAQDDANRRARRAAFRPFPVVCTVCNWIVTAFCNVDGYPQVPEHREDGLICRGSGYPATPDSDGTPEEVEEAPTAPERTLSGGELLAMRKAAA